jgi:hypothetical protein
MIREYRINNMECRRLDKISARFFFYLQIEFLPLTKSVGLIKNWGNIIIILDNVSIKQQFNYILLLDFSFQSLYACKMVSFDNNKE